MQAYDAVQLFAPVTEAFFVLGGVLLAAAVALDPNAKLCSLEFVPS